MTKMLHEYSPVTLRSARPAFLGVVLLMQLVLIGCGVRPPSPGIETGGIGRYSHLTFVPLLADEVRLEWNDGFNREAGQRQLAGWNTQSKAGQIAVELLALAGTRVTPVEDVKGFLLGPDEQSDWESRVWQRLKAAGRINPGGPIVLLRQNALDALGRQYNPLANFLALGPLGVVIGAATREDRFQPSFILALNTDFGAAMVGSSRCSIGFDARLLDADTGAILATADAVLGQEKIPAKLAKKKWSEMNGDERGMAQTYCIAALRRGVAQALNELEVMHRR